MKVENCCIGIPETDKKYTHHQDYRMGTERPTIHEDEPNTGTTNKPNETGLLIRQPL